MQVDPELEFLSEQLSLECVDWCPDSKKFSDVWELIWRDLKTKTAKYPPEQRTTILHYALLQRLVAEGLLQPEEIARLNSFHSLVRVTNLDVLIFTVLEQEWNACNVAFSDCKKEKLVIPFGHLNVFSIPSKSCDEIRVGVVNIGSSNNVECAVFCDSVFSLVRPKIAILTGICAIRQDKFDLGDVVGSSSVHQIDRGKKLDEKTLENLTPFSLRPKVAPILGVFNPDRTSWLDNYSDFKSKLKNTGEKVDLKVKTQKPAYESGVLLAGDYVRRDNFLLHYTSHVNDKVVGIEMEGAGFASSCQSNDLDWIVFRGASDFGDRKKGDKFHAIAALNASLVAKSFIKHFFEELGTFDDTNEECEF